MPQLRDIGEKRLIREIIQKGWRAAEGMLPLNDDAQIISPPLSFNFPQLISTDRTPTNLRPLVWGIYDYEQYGQYHAISTLSDIAAMGAYPFGYLLNIAAPATLDLDVFVSVFNGVTSILKKHKTMLLGGDTKEGTELSLVGIALGQSWKETVLTRSGCKVGDKLIVSGGPLGSIPAAHALFSRHGWRQTNIHEQMLTDAFHQFFPQIAEARLLQDSGVCTSCMDNSDGLIASLDEIADASGVGFKLDQKTIEVSEQVAYVASILERDPVELLLGAGGDFRLVATVSEFLPELSNHFYVIGEACEADSSMSGSSAANWSRMSRWDHFRM